MNFLKNLFKITAKKQKVSNEAEIKLNEKPEEVKTVAERLHEGLRIKDYVEECIAELQRISETAAEIRELYGRNPIGTEEYIILPTYLI